MTGVVDVIEALTRERDELLAALEDIESHFLPGDERRTYGDATATLDAIRRKARAVLADRKAGGK